MSELTHERLHEILNYDLETGIFIRKVSNSNRIKVGSVAGSIDKDGYLIITIDWKRYKAHRLAWLYIYGYFPEHDIDHINRNPSDNRIKNLREVSRSCNMRNTGNHRDNTSGVKGVRFSEKRKKWMSQIQVNRKCRFLGYYIDFNDAVCARLAGEQCLDWNGCDSSSPAFKYVEKMIMRKPC